MRAVSSPHFLWSVAKSVAFNEKHLRTNMRILLVGYEWRMDEIWRALLHTWLPVHDANYMFQRLAVFVVLSLNACR